MRVTNSIVYEYEDYIIIVNEVEYVLLSALVHNLKEKKMYCEPNIYVGDLEQFCYIDVIEKITKGEYATC